MRASHRFEIVVVVAGNRREGDAGLARTLHSAGGGSGLPIAHPEGYCGVFTANAVKGGPLPFSFGSNM
jgi:hypothetical protein